MLEVFCLICLLIISSAGSSNPGRLQNQSREKIDASRQSLSNILAGDNRGGTNLNEAVVHTRPKRFAIAAAAATVIGVIGSLFGIGKGIADEVRNADLSRQLDGVNSRLDGVNSRLDETDQQLRQLQLQVNERLDAVDEQLIRLDSEVQAVSRLVSLTGEWGRVAAVFGPDLQRLKFLTHHMTNDLQRDPQGRFIVNANSQRWADAVMSLRCGGIRQIMMNVHDMVKGSSSITSTRSIMDIYVDMFPKSPTSRLCTAVDNMIDLLKNMQESGYICWIVALAIHNNTDQINSTVLPLAMHRLPEQEATYTRVTRLCPPWPGGPYGLISVVNTSSRRVLNHSPTAADLTCPDPPEEWLKACWFQDTEDRRNGDAISQPNHFTTLHRYSRSMLCSCTRDQQNNISWPAGSYCLLAYANPITTNSSNLSEFCPTGFQGGFIRWDDEDDRNGYHGCITEFDPQALPLVFSGFFGIFGIPCVTLQANEELAVAGEWSTTLVSCCRSDGSANTAITLPIGKPFMLLRHGGVCQQVRKMRVTDEWFHWDCENTGNFNWRVPPHPDDTSGGRDIRLQMCYYEYNGTHDRVQRYININMVFMT